MKYKCLNGFYFGFVDLCLSDLVKGGHEIFQNFSVLITCLDSNKKTANLDKWLDYLNGENIEYEKIYDSVWIPERFVFKIFEDKETFFGFDEIYLFKNKFNLHESIASIFTTDGYDFSEELPDVFTKMFFSIGADRYFSDGCGLNYVCESLDVIKKIDSIIKNE